MTREWIRRIGLWAGWANGKGRTSEFCLASAYAEFLERIQNRRCIPALGILVEIPGLNKYRLNVGCDTCFQVAISRCLTKIYQGVSNETMFDEAALPRLEEELPYFVNNDEIAMFQRYMVFSQFTVDNRGQFPLSLFAETASYAFDPAVWTQRSSYAEEVQRLVAFFQGQGHNVYLRDVSFLGFPSVFCYVPEVSALGRKNVPPPTLTQTPFMLELDEIESKALKLKSCSDSELEEVANVLQKLEGRITLTDVFGIKLAQTSPWTDYHLALLLSQIWYRLGRLDKAWEAFKAFKKIREDDKNPYYELAERYLERRAAGTPVEEAVKELADDPAQAELAQIVADDLADPGAVLRYVKLPNCPDCKECELREDCVTVGRLAMMERLLSAMASRQIEQAALSWVY